MTLRQKCMAIAIGLAVGLVQGLAAVRCVVHGQCVVLDAFGRPPPDE